MKAIRPRATSPASCERDACFAINGYPVSIRSALAAAKLHALLGTHAVKKCADPAVIHVRLVEDLGVYEPGCALFSPGILLGQGFALDYAARTLIYPCAAPLTQSFKNLGEQNPFTRTIIFSIALLAQHEGLESVACNSARNQAPLYVHASAVLTRRGALVFCGECTFGKTTISTKLLKNFPLLEDDQVTILTSPPADKNPLPPRVVVFGDSRLDPVLRKKNVFAALNDGTVPLAGIFWLKKDPRNALEVLEQSEAAAMLLNPMTDSQHSPAVRHRLQLLRSLLQAVPCRRLAFKKESAPLEEFLKQEGYA